MHKEPHQRRIVGEHISALIPRFEGYLQSLEECRPEERVQVLGSRGRERVVCCAGTRGNKAGEKAEGSDGNRIVADIKGTCPNIEIPPVAIHFNAWHTSWPFVQEPATNI